MSHWYLGTIGFSYKDWLGEFYPRGMSQRGYLPYYCKVFNSVELDTTFHSVPKASIVKMWSSTTPDDFVFCLKVPRVITHELRLRGVQGLMDEFLSSISSLQKKNGPILIQLPPSFSQESYSILAEFLGILPPSHRYAIEFRHPSWYHQKTEQLLTYHKVCWVAIDYPNIPKRIACTTDFLYIRWIGVNGTYQHHTHERVDKTTQLKAWIQNINPIAQQVSAIYGYFNNDYAGFAAGTCMRFKRLLGLDSNEPQEPYQERLF